MQPLLPYFAGLALFGFVLSLVAHLAGYAGIERPFGFDPWPLHIGIFVVWFPAVLVAQRNSRDFPQSDMWDSALRGCPKWMQYILFGIFGYAILSFIFFVGPSSTSESEASKVRGFSGHWLIFYYAAFAILYSGYRIDLNDPIPKCENGHPVKPSHSYCPVCGSNLGDPLGPAD